MSSAGKLADHFDIGSTAAGNFLKENEKLIKEYKSFERIYKKERLEIYNCYSKFCSANILQDSAMEIKTRLDKENLLHPDEQAKICEKMYQIR